MIERLTKLLLEYQKKQGLTDSQLSTLLIKEDGNHISASMISYLRSGKRKLGIDVVRAIWANIPARTIHYACMEWFAPPIDFNTIKQLADLQAMR